MKKLLIITAIFLAIIVSGLAYYALVYTKSFSPDTDVNFEANGLTIHINYDRPYKKGRVIFDSAGLVPYGKVWRTGANEATVFETNQDLKIKDQILKKGTYSFFTLPGPTTWKIIFNSEYGQWGVDFNGMANRDPKNDVLTVEVPAVVQQKEIEQFTIEVDQAGDEMELILLWDKTLVAIPFSR